MSDKKRIILIGNYRLDEQESMERFAKMLLEGFSRSGLQAEIWRPKVFFGGRFSDTVSGLGKWMGYLDKWILFPVILRLRIARKKSLRTSNVHFHICDHSNSPYLGHLPKGRSLVTCHDVLAIRGALGYADAHCPASGMGKFLQKWILHHLSGARKVAAVSQLTMGQLTELSKGNKSGNSLRVIIPNAFNADFKPMDEKLRREILVKAGLDPKVSYLLHVGSGLPRKNRVLLLEMLAALKGQWDGKVYFAGEPMGEDLRDHAKALGVEDRVISVAKPDHELLVALYSACEAFVFPSFSEGFGWPVIEAQACGVPVIASNREPLPEVSGGAALHADPKDPRAFADAFLSLCKNERRAKLIAAGSKNIERFSTPKIIDSYIKLHAIRSE